MSKRTYTYLLLLCLASLLLYGAKSISNDALDKYERQLSQVVYDRNAEIVSLRENSKGHYALPVTEVPEEFIELLVKKEDRFFYLHPGINPGSTLRALYTYIRSGKSGGSSTLTQQLTKNLLNNESNRTINNKLIELMYALSIELFNSKDEILVMYVNSVYLGNQLQGFETASYAYFNKPLSEATPSERISLLATLSYPSSRNPWEEANLEYAQILSQRLLPDGTYEKPSTSTEYSFQATAAFELRTAGVTCRETCATTIDLTVTDTVRDILSRHVRAGYDKNIKNGAVVIIDPKTEELIALVGSIDPRDTTQGNQINMAIKPRPIGSTVKPLIYAKGFMLGLRPYTLVEDREYKYPIATGFPLYPKNYDGQYRGIVTLHEALSNSLNVPTVKVLEYIGLNEFYTFLSNDLKFKPIQDYDSYQYGIALGGLEMDLLTLTHYFTLFPRGGTLEPMRMVQMSNETFDLPPQSTIESFTQILPEEYTELVHTIISDRYTGVNQFGLTGNLNLTTTGYGVKTGTSRDFHDSWVVGYTGDFVVGVWLGNAENKPLEQVSGSSGAGAVWHDVMEYMLSTDYNQNTPTQTPHVTRIPVRDNDEWGLAGDIVTEHQDLLMSDDLILNLHQGDTFALTDHITIPLKARRDVTWSINGSWYKTAQETSFTPDTIGTYEVQAYDETSGEREIVIISITKLE